MKLDRKILYLNAEFFGLIAVSTGLTSKVISFGVYLFWRSSLHLRVSAFHVLSGGTICGVFALISPFTVSNS